MSRLVTYPELRLEVISAVSALSSAAYQDETWGRFDEEGLPFYDDLDINISTLYDDVAVLPDPSSAVPDVLYQAEVASMQELSHALTPLIAKLGDVSDSRYRSHDNWRRVQIAARRALEVMKTCDGQV